MYTESIAAWNKAGLDTALQLAHLSMETVERLTKVQLESGKAALLDFAKSAKTAAEVKDAQEWLAVRGKSTESAVEKLMGYSREVYDVLSKAQNEATQVIEKRASEIQKTLISGVDKFASSGPAGSELATAFFKSSVAAANSVLDSINEATKQAFSYADASIKSATTSTKAGRKGA